MEYKKTFLTFTVSVCILILSACVTAERNPDAKKTNSSIVEENNQEKVQQIKKIFYSLPSPLALTMLFKEEGIKYDETKLLPTERRNEYLTSTKKALSLGVYGADLSYAGLFGEHQDAIQYFTATHLVAADIGIERTFQKEFISRLEKNSNNKDTLLSVIGEFFINNDKYLKNHQHKDLSYYVLTGGWVEGMYLGTSMADTSNSADGIRKIIASQQASLDNLVDLLEGLKENEEVLDLIISIEELSVLFHQLPELKKDSINGQHYELNNSSLLVIREKVADIRNQLVSAN